MFRIRAHAVLGAALVCVLGRGALAQRPPADSVLQAIRFEGMERSQAASLAEELMDVVGPRLTASPAATAASDWAMTHYAGWGIPARRERYGTWTGWRRGITHLDLVRSRERELEATILAWSRGTGGRPVEGDVALLPDVASADELNAFLARARGAFVMVSATQPSCRSQQQWAEFATPDSRQRMARAQDSVARRWNARGGSAGAAAESGADAGGNHGIECVVPHHAVHARGQLAGRARVLIGAEGVDVGVGVVDGGDPGAGQHPRDELHALAVVGGREPRRDGAPDDA